MCAWKSRMPKETCLQENCMKTAQKVSGIVFASDFNFVAAKKGLSSHFAELTVLQPASKRREEEMKSAQQQKSTQSSSSRTLVS